MMTEYRLVKIGTPTVWLDDRAKETLDRQRATTFTAAMLAVMWLMQHRRDSGAWMWEPAGSRT